MSNEGLAFSVDSLLLGELGERLVTKNYIALAELIKNAYDADAEKVTIMITNAKSDYYTRDGRIIVEDFGHGMTFDQIKEYWMRIATPNKQRNPYSPKYHRRKTGDKGIGRFACRKLAKQLVLTSIAAIGNNKYQKTKVTFDWNTYQPGLLLEAITNKYTTEVLDSVESTGTTLKLIGLQEKWSQRDFDTLRRRIGELSVISPTTRKGFPEDPGMLIKLQAKEFRSGQGLLLEQIKNAGWGRLKGKVSQDGIVSLILEAKKIGTVPYELPNVYKHIPNITFDIAVIWQRLDYLRDAKTLSGGLITEIFENYSGIKVFLDGFRVYPYGDPENDWLSVDEIQARKLAKISDHFDRVANNLIGVDPTRAKLNHPRNQNLVGEVRLSNEQKKLFDVPINREGFIENDSSIQLRACLKEALEWLTLYYTHYLYLNEQELIRKATEELKEVLEEANIKPDVRTDVSQQVLLVDSAMEALGDITDKLINSPEAQIDSNVKIQYEKTKDAAIKVVQTTVDRLENQTNSLRTIASTGALMFIFTHEAQAVISSLDTHANELEEKAKNLPEKEKKLFLNLASSFRETRDRFDDQIRLFGTLSDEMKKGERKRLRIYTICKQVKNVFAGFIKDYNINIEDKINRSDRTGLMLETELYSIIINLLSNALKAVLASEESAKKIKIVTVQKKNNLTLRIFDDGIGIKKEYREFVKQPLVSDPEGKLYKNLKGKVDERTLLAVGSGRGLGLSIVVNILKTYNKELRFIDTKSPWKTCVEVDLP